MEWSDVVPEISNAGHYIPQQRSAREEHTINQLTTQVGYQKLGRPIDILIE